MLVGVLMFSSGCSLRTEIDEYHETNPAVSDNDAQETEAAAGNTAEPETTQPQTVQIVVGETDGAGNSTDGTGGSSHMYETVPIKELEEPVDESGAWTNYLLGTGTMDEQWEAPTFGEHGSRFYVHDYPAIYVPEDEEQQTEINNILRQYVQNDYSDRFQIKDIDIELTCTVLNASRFVCYQLEGEVRHIGDDVRYEDEREYRYYFTIDRMTGQIINLETAIGVNTVYKEISSGNYEVIHAEDSVFERFSDDLLADVYVNEPLFADDTGHELDFYIQDGHVYVVIWVGEQNGSYAILRLNKESNIK